MHPRMATVCMIQRRKQMESILSNGRMPNDFLIDVETSLPKLRICMLLLRLFMYLRLLNICRTPGKELEEHLNANYGQGNLIYEDLCSLTPLGLEEGWVANIEVDGEQYRRSKISLPSEENKFFSITTVYVLSSDACA